MDVGIKLSQPGHDILGAGDQELQFSSSWPTLQVPYSARFTGLTSDNPLILVSHNLGFSPAFMVYDPSGEYSVGGNNVSCDKKNIYWHPGGGGNPPFSVSVAIKIFNLDLEKNFKAPQISVSTSAQAHGDENFGFKISKDTKDIHSSDLRDFIIHSSTRGPMVHAVSNGASNDKLSNLATFSYTHDLPYNPMFFAYTQVSDDKYFLVSSFATIKTSGQKISILGVTGKSSIVVLKDPFQISDNIIKVS